MQKALLNQIGLEHIFDRIFCLTDRCGQIIQAYRAAFEFMNNGLEKLAVHDIKAFAIDFQHGERTIGKRFRDLTICLDLRKIPHAT